MASTSDGLTPAISRALCTAGTMASRCARRGDLGHDAAEAGVQLDAGGDLVGEQFDRAVLAQPDDADAGLVAGGLDPEHHDVTEDRPGQYGHQGIIPIIVVWRSIVHSGYRGRWTHHGVGVRPGGLVVVLAQAESFEAVRGVETDRGPVVGPHFEEHRGVVAVGDAQHGAHQALADALALPGAVDADGVHLGLEVRRAPVDGEPGIADQGVVVGVRAEVVVVGVPQLGEEDPFAPRIVPAEQLLLQLDASGQVLPAQPGDAHGQSRLTCLRGTASIASGRRR